MSNNIRVATLADAESLRDIYQAAITDIPHRADINPKQKNFWLESGSKIESWEWVIENYNVFVYIQNEQIVGFVSLFNSNIKYLYVHPTNKGNGIAFEMLDFIENFAKENGIVELFSDVTGVAAHMFSVRGFEKQKEITVPMPNTAPFVFHKMMKKLNIALAVNKADVDNSHIKADKLS
jgi:N-acetylglutamate synthase-like GNAT family acetyltransferase